MKTKIFYGATVNEAVEQGLAYFNLTEDEVKVDVKDPGSKGFLGFGKRQASVEMTVLQSLVNVNKSEGIVPEQEKIEVLSQESEEIDITEDIHHDEEIDKQASIDAVVAYLTNIARDMHIQDLKVEIKATQPHLVIELHTVEAGRLIGKRGNTLNALQQLSQIVYMNHLKQFAIVELDIEGYRELRTQTLEELALNMAKKAKHFGKPVKLEPMPSYERKIVHKALAGIANVSTRSEGKEPYRYLVIKVN